jgi:hypothetical protein
MVRPSSRNSHRDARRGILLGVAEHVWGNTANGAGYPAFTYTIPVMIVIVAVVRPGVRDFFLLALIVFLFMWTAVTAIAALYDSLVFQPEKRRAEDEEAARRASAAALMAMKERADAEARKAEQAARQRTEEAYRLYVKHRERVRQDEAQFFQAFAAYRAQVDFHGTMDPAALRRGFADNLGRLNVPWGGLLVDSLSPEVRAILEMAVASPTASLSVVTLKTRRPDGSPVIAPFLNKEEAAAFAALDAEAQWHIIGELTPRLLRTWPERIRMGI